MSNKPTVSIIIPYYKKREFFSSTIQSIKNQSFKNFEIILIYDDIDLKELKYVKKILKLIPNKKIIINQKNLGPGLSRNKGISKSKGKYLAFCDADDIWNKDKLKLQIEFMKKNKIQFLHSDYHIIDSKNKKIGKFVTKPIISKTDLLKSCDIGLSTVIMDRKLITNKNKFCNLTTKEDYFLWLNIIKKVKFINSINKFLVSWRFTEGSLSNSFFQKIRDAFKLYYSFEKYGVVLSFLFTIRLSFYALIKKIRIYDRYN